MLPLLSLVKAIRSKLVMVITSTCSITNPDVERLSACSDECVGMLVA